MIKLKNWLECIKLIHCILINNSKFIPSYFLDSNIEEY